MHFCWIGENDWDYRARVPAKIGRASSSEACSDVIYKSMAKYAGAHPDQFEWVVGHLTNFSYVWQSEVEVLKDGDCVREPNPRGKFA